MRPLLFVSLLIFNFGLGVWNLQQFLKGGDVEHAVWIVVCLATSVICGLVVHQEHRINS